MVVIILDFYFYYYIVLILIGCSYFYGTVLYCYSNWSALETATCISHYVLKIIIYEAKDCEDGHQQSAKEKDKDREKKKHSVIIV